MAKRYTDAEYAARIEQYPKEWAIVKASVIRIKISCQLAKAENLFAELSALGLAQPENYVRVVSDHAHSGKFDTIVDLSKIYAVHNLFYLNLNQFKQEPGTAQIGVRYIAERLIQDGVNPRTIAEREIEKARESA